MPQVVKREDPIEGASFTGLYRSCFIQLEVYRDRPTPACAFLLSLAFWSAAICRLCWPHLVDPQVASACLKPEVFLSPATVEWRSYILHGLWPVEPSYLRSFLVSLALIVQGYTVEYEMGTMSYMGHLAGAHLACAFVLLRFNLVLCFTSVETALVALAVVMHRVNPKIHSDGLDPSIRVSFTVEPRWHMWIVQVILLITSSSFPAAVMSHSVGLLVGALLCVRDPEAWQDMWQALRRGSPTIGYTLHIVLLLFSITFMPTSMQALPVDLPGALADGRAFSWSWWQAAAPASLPLLHLGVTGQMAPQAFYLMRLLIALAIPMLLSPFHAWLRVYAGACVILIMYAMTSTAWVYPHVGFLVLGYSAWALWRLPSMYAGKYE